MNEKPTIETKIKESVPLSPEVAELAEQDLVYKNLGDLYSQKSKAEALLGKTGENSTDREALLGLIEEINGLLDIENADRARVRKGEDVARLKEINRELPTLIKTIKNLLAKKDASKTAKEKRDIDIELGGINLKKISLLRERALLKLKKKNKGIKVGEKRIESEAPKRNVDPTLDTEKQEAGKIDTEKLEVWTEKDEKILAEILETIRREEENIRKYEAELDEIIAYKYGGSSRPSEKHLDRNEDSQIFLPGKKIFSVFDGVGGNAAGDFASSFVAQKIEAAALSIASALTSSEKEKALDKIFRQTNVELVKETKRLGLDGSSTTASFLHIFKEDGQPKAIIANIGDSRIYLLMEDGRLVQATEDNSRINLILQSPEYTPEQAEALKQKLNNVENAEDLTEDEMRIFDTRNTITSALGASEQEAPRISTISLEGVKKILLTTDGIHDPLTDKRIAETLAQEKSSTEIANDLISLAEKENTEKTFRHKKDDKTAIVINV